MKPRLLDLFCGAGGAAMGYHQAGFAVIGVDHRSQPNYPFELIEADAMELMARLADGEEAWGWSSADFAAVHASPPCPRYSLVSGFQGVAGKHPDLVDPTRKLLDRIGLPYVIENVPGAPLRRDVVLCGEMFGHAEQRGQGNTSVGAELEANAAAGESRHRRDIAESLAKAALLKIEEAEREAVTVRDLHSTSEKIDGLVPA